MTAGRIVRWTLIALVVVGLVPACGGGGGDEPFSFPGQTLLTIAPTHGTSAGGTQVTLTGSGFLDPNHAIQGVRVGGKDAPEWEVVNDSTIVFTTPSHDLGRATVAVLGANSQRQDGVILVQGFTFVAPTVFVADGPGSANPQLYRVDLTTGNVRLIGSTGYAVDGMALSPDGVLYAVEASPPQRLIRIDPETGIGTPMGLLRASGSGDPVSILDVTFLGDRLLGRTSDNRLVEIDRTNGTVVPRSNLAGTAPGSAVASDGEVVFLAPIGSPRDLEVWDPQLDMTGPGVVLNPGATVESLTAQGGRLFGIDGTPSGGASRELYEIDPETGAVIAVTNLPALAGAVARAP